jgi:hypothetical protein
MKNTMLSALILLLATSHITKADEVAILAASIIHQSQDEYLVNVKLQHQDTGWEHYADEWRIVDQQGNIIGSRTLFHPHVDEQPFTRALSNVKLDKNLTIIFIEAHDKKHGWSKQKLELDLTKMQDGKLIVKTNP